MDIRYNREERSYIATERIGSQTMKMEMMEWDYNEGSNTVYYNVSVCIYNKRKHYERNFNEARITGNNPIATIAVGLKMYKELEKTVCESAENRNWNVVFLVRWEDNRRRNAYEKLLVRYGYKIDKYDNTKVLIKRISR